ncbi:MAG: hypothetical protein R3C49_25575 [Planctomycetaceae bacterium]
MTRPTVLSIGQCRPDSAAIRHVLTSNFDVNFETADDAVQALHFLRTEAVALVLINRKLDVDYSDGIDILKTMKTDPVLDQIPVMLVSNFPDWQQKAVDAGATWGFGKDSLNSPDTIDRLRGVLA